MFRVYGEMHFVIQSAYHTGLLLNPSSFNQKLIPWLVWYNTERPHWGLNLKSPMQLMLTARPEKSNMWWTNT